GSARSAGLHLSPAGTWGRVGGASAALFGAGRLHGAEEGDDVFRGAGVVRSEERMRVQLERLRGDGSEIRVPHQPSAVFEGIFVGEDLSGVKRRARHAVPLRECSCRTLLFWSPG